MEHSVTLIAELENVKGNLEGVRVAFSPFQCFSFDDGTEDIRCIEILGNYLATLPGLAFYGNGPFLEYFISHFPRILKNLVCIVTDNFKHENKYEIECISPTKLKPQIQNIFLCETLAYSLMKMRQRVKGGKATVIGPEQLWNLAPESVPARTWVPVEFNIYPIEVPEIEFERGMDMLLIDCPSRNLSMMPNGLGYVHNALKKTSIKFQTLDLDIIVYHRYHIHRLFDLGGRVILPDGQEAPNDPWLAQNYDFWASGSESESSDGGSLLKGFFDPLIKEIVDAIVIASPKILGLSIQQCNEAFSRVVVNAVREKLPDVIIIVGGYSCYNPDVGFSSFPEADYMVIGEAELTVGPLVEALCRGERPKNLPGVLSKGDSSDCGFLPGPTPHNIDKIEFPKYQWFNDLSIYQNYNGYQLTPIIASRGCRWSRCTFCAERFYWRIRSAPNFVDELEWLIKQGCSLFMFNESDLNGMPEKVLEICDEIIRRGLNKKAKLTGQLRIHKKCTREFFDKLKAANVVALRFGVDAFSENTLRLQKKGYTVEMAAQNLKDCWEAGIFTEINWVIGVPGETEQDIQEGIEFILENQKYIGRFANLNPLILVNGSVYWIDPDQFNIKFREDKEELFKKFPRALPADKWYSTEPFIDAQVRKNRFERIALALYEAGFPIGDWASKAIENAKSAKDIMRFGSTNREAGSVLIEEGENNNSSEFQEIRNTSTHKIIVSKGYFYAVPIEFKRFELDSVQLSSLPGVVQGNSEPELIEKLELSLRYANSRGFFNPQEKESKGIHNISADGFWGPKTKNSLEFDPIIIKHQDQFFAVHREEWNRMQEGQWGGIEGNSLMRNLASRILPLKYQKVIKYILKSSDPLGAFFKTIKGESPSKTIRVIGTVSKDASPEFMWEIGNYNVVKFDNLYYAVPQGEEIDWYSGIVASSPNVFIGRTVKEVSDQLAQKLGKYIYNDPLFRENKEDSKSSGPSGESSIRPKLLGSIKNYNIVTYEGWVYGIPQELGKVDLTETDIMEMPGVIRDVSQDAVENEVMLLVGT